MKIAFYTLLAIIVLLCAVFGPRLAKDMRKKRSYENTFAIQNMETGTCLRPKDAGYQNDVPLILYPHQNWECITWQFIGLIDGTTLLKNLYSQRTFAPDRAPVAGITFSQCNLGGSALQQWVVEPDGEGIVRLRLSGSELYLTAPSAETNARPVLQAKSGEDNQRWRLIPQTPIV